MKELYEEAISKIKISENELTASDLEAVYNYQQGKLDQKESRIKELEQVFKSYHCHKCGDTYDLELTEANDLICSNCGEELEYWMSMGFKDQAMKIKLRSR